MDLLRRALEAIPAVRLAVVFGSQAEGNARAGSDIDIGLLFEASSLDISHLAVDLERLARCPVHLIALEYAPPLLRSEISRHGSLLLEREPYAWADFRARAMIDWWDWAPTAAIVRRAVAARLVEEAGDGAS
jgi:predicted nucleotidyltransferase